MKIRPVADARAIADLRPPRPRRTAANAEFWAALVDERIVVQRCRSCERWIHYPRPRCPHCGASDLSFEEVDGDATIYTLTVAHQATAPHFAHELPQVIAVVELGVGVRLTTTIMTDRPDTLDVGARVVPWFDHGDDGVTLLRYRPLADSP